MHTGFKGLGFKEYIVSYLPICRALGTGPRLLGIWRDEGLLSEMRIKPAGAQKPNEYKEGDTVSQGLKYQVLE